VQLPELDVQQLEEDGEVTTGSGYKYTNSDGLTMFEFHVDSVKNVKAVWLMTNLGGNLSVRKPPDKKPLIIFGHDECIFKQYTMTGKQWYGPNGETYVVPKDDGCGVMIGSLHSNHGSLVLVWR